MRLRGAALTRAAGTPAEARLRTLLQEHYGLPSGEVQLPPRRNYSAVVHWPAPHAQE